MICFTIISEIITIIATWIIAHYCTPQLLSHFQFTNVIGIKRYQMSWKLIILCFQISTAGAHSKCSSFNFNHLKFDAVDSKNFILLGLIFRPEVSE